VTVVGIERSRTYLTPCDEHYHCLIDAKERRSSGCKQLVEGTGRIRVFSSERQARAAGYMSQAESIFGESDNKF
jgi:hypothetical protein